jgi:glyoxylase-like metal-dependent hydrolase (beta-lactamase superfamily II)
MDALPVADPWFVRTRVDPTITLLTEPAIHPLLRCNIWHVQGRDRDLVVDTGLGVASLVDAADDLFSGNTVAVATHAHTDHIGSLHEFEERAIHHSEAAKVASIKGVLELDTSETDEATFVQLEMWGYDIRDGLLSAVPSADFPLLGHPRHPAVPTRVLSEDDVFDLGGRHLSVLHLPGHSPGSIGLYDRASRVLFSGDAVYDGALLDDLEESDVGQYRETMRRLRRLDVEVVHAGHGPSMGRERFRSIIDAYLDRTQADR